MTQILGNPSILDTFHKMQTRNRMAHGILLYGEKGLGKKTIAEHLAQRLICTAEDDAIKPCGVCKACKMAEKHCHPDIIYPEKSGKLGGYSADMIRTLCQEAIVPPSEGIAKCYVFTDCDAMEVRQQNLLLKSVEEPPDYLYFIFTATSPNVFLSTIRSRIISLPVQPLPESTCTQALQEEKYSPEECEEALEAFHGNLGMAKSYLENSEIKQLVLLTKQTIHSIIEHDEYHALQIAATTTWNRNALQDYLLLLDKTLRDALVLRQIPDATLLGCDREGAKKLSLRIASQSLQSMHLAILHARDSLKANVGIPMILTALFASFFEVGSPTIQ